MQYVIPGTIAVLVLLLVLARRAAKRSEAENMLLKADVELRPLVDRTALLEKDLANAEADRTEKARRYRDSLRRAGEPIDRE